MSGTYEDETKKDRVWFYASPSLKRDMQDLAGLDRRSLSQWIRLALEDVVRERLEGM